MSDIDIFKRRVKNAILAILLIIASLTIYYEPRIFMSELEKKEEIKNFIENNEEKKAEGFIERAYSKDEIENKKYEYNLNQVYFVE